MVLVAVNARSPAESAKSNRLAVKFDRAAQLGQHFDDQVDELRCPVDVEVALEAKHECGRLRHDTHREVHAIHGATHFPGRQLLNLAAGRQLGTFGLSPARSGAVG